MAYFRQMSERYLIHIETEEGRRVASYSLSEVHSIPHKIVVALHDDVLRQQGDIPRMESYALVSHIVTMSVRRIRELVSKYRY